MITIALTNHNADEYSLCMTSNVIRMEMDTQTPKVGFTLFKPKTGFAVAQRYPVLQSPMKSEMI